MSETYPNKGDSVDEALGKECIARHARKTLGGAASLRLTKMKTDQNKIGNGSKPRVYQT